MELTDTLVDDYDVVEFAEGLTERCVELLEASMVGIVLTDEKGSVRNFASSSGRTRDLELLEIQNREGPCYDCVASGKRIEDVVLDDETLARWPEFHPAAIEAGYHYVLALPMRLRDATIGAVGVFYETPPDVPSADLSLAQAFARIATIGILQERATSDSERHVNQLQNALNSRVVIEQAKGMLAIHHDISLDEAFTRLRTEARSQNRRLTELAHEITARQDPD